MGALPGWPDSLASSRQLFARESLRTLCLASREVSEAEYHSWRRRHHQAMVGLQDRARELDRLYEEMEQSLQVGWLQLSRTGSAGPTGARVWGSALWDEQVK